MRAMSLLDLPSDLIEVILCMLPYADVARTRRVCQALCELASSDQVWCSLLMRDFGVDGTAAAAQSQSPLQMYQALMDIPRFLPHIVSPRLQLEDARTVWAKGVMGHQLAFGSMPLTRRHAWELEVLCDEAAQTPPGTRTDWFFPGVLEDTGVFRGRKPDTSFGDALCLAGKGLIYGRDGYFYVRASGQRNPIGLDPWAIRVGDRIGIAVDTLEDRVYLYRNGKLGFIMPISPLKDLVFVLELVNPYGARIHPATSFVRPWLLTPRPVPFGRGG